MSVRYIIWGICSEPFKKKTYCLYILMDDVSCYRPRGFILDHLERTRNPSFRKGKGVVRVPRTVFLNLWVMIV